MIKFQLFHVQPYKKTFFHYQIVTPKSQIF
uniref:Uncharacterized protein n=1 Tax=Myoviridae sp. ct2AC8 TaxID=2827655 RepID=A0A8S5TPU5_9CAUD|nr:MAG TPA: hypothetical protein [Myoviridae sp. ct2AC8]